MSRFVIRGGQRLGGEITASGNKNAVLPMLAACLLTDQEVVLENVPSIRDVDAMLDILAYLGAEIAREGNTVRVRATTIRENEIPRELGEKIRTSVLMVGPLLSRTGQVRIAAPGGDMIGRRRLDAHFYGLQGLGVQVDIDKLEFHQEGRLQGAVLFFDEASVTATEHIMLVATLADGTTTLRNVASEPHVQDLARLLIDMGAEIEGVGTNTLTIHGVERLGGARHRVTSDHIEVGSYLAIAAATGGALTVRDTTRGHYWMMHRVFQRFGLDLHLETDHIVLPGGQVARIQADAGGMTPRIDDGPWPQFPSDMMSSMLVLATQAEGTVLFFEKMFESRMYFVDPLIQMGANIIVCDPHRVIVTGPSRLRGQTVRSPDIRAGMGLLMAALCAEGQPSVVQNADIIDRGYERVEEKLQSLGADIVREDDPS